MDRVFLVPPVESVDPMPLVGPFLAEAERLGVRRVVLLGSAIVLPNAPSALELAASVRAQPGWVVLRASGFMQNFLRPHPLGERIRRHGEIRTAAGDGRVGWIDAHDIAAAASALLTDPGVEPAARPARLPAHRAEGVELPGRRGDPHRPHPRPVQVVRIGADEQAAHYRATGMPADFAAALAAVEDGIRDRSGRSGQHRGAGPDRPPAPPLRRVRPRPRNRVGERWVASEVTSAQATHGVLGGQRHEEPLHRAAGLVKLAAVTLSG